MNEQEQQWEQKKTEKSKPKARRLTTQQPRTWAKTRRRNTRRQLKKKCVSCVDVARFWTCEQFGEQRQVGFVRWRRTKMDTQKPAWQLNGKRVQWRGVGHTCETKLESNMNQKRLANTTPSTRNKSKSKNNSKSSSDKSNNNHCFWSFRLGSLAANQNEWTRATMRTEKNREEQT